ncbi:MAG: hypothetical protein JW725_01155 [Candidatus Babeliaceae bacterium]|nr:hypothetical protein [Candidatus Babeliaceae bacterium]
MVHLKAPIKGFYMRSGFIIRSYLPERLCCTLFDIREGLIFCSFCARHTFPRCINGSFIEAETSPRSPYLLQRVNMVRQPACWVTKDLLFLHHFLEISASFLALNEPYPELVSLFAHLFRPLPDGIQEIDFKLAFMGSFFLAIGIYPEHFRTNPNFLISRLQDTMVNERKGAVNRSLMIEWLHHCIETHPSAHFFKTTTFLKQIGQT